MTITIITSEPLKDFPPAITLLQTLDQLGHSVTFISPYYDSFFDSMELLNASHCFVRRQLPDWMTAYHTDRIRASLAFRTEQLLRRSCLRRIPVLFSKEISGADVVWVLNENTTLLGGKRFVERLGDFMQTMYELHIRNGKIPAFYDYAANKALLTVVPEYNRAHIVKAFYDLPHMPAIRVENSFAGAVLPTYSLLEKLPLHIVGETMKAVRHHLLGLPGATLAEIRQISSHPQAIAQCDEFLATLPDVQIVPSANTAISAREVAQLGDKTRAAIASVEAAKEYGLVSLAENIQTSATNTTRFFILSMSPIPLGTPSKATVTFRVNNEVGALVKVLSSFAESGLNMSRIESRPLPDTPFQYFFSADFEGEMDAAHLSRAMAAARPYTCALRLLGGYPKAGR